jgi:hypothetical protein
MGVVPVVSKKGFERLTTDYDYDYDYEKRLRGARFGMP